MMALDQQGMSGEEFGKRTGDDDAEPKKPNGASTTQLPVIDIVPGKLSERTAGAIGALRSAGLDIFDRGGQLVRPVRIADPETLDGVRRPVGALVLRPIEPEWVRLRLAEVARWRKWDSRREDWRAADPPYDVPRTITVAPDEGAWPYLRAIVRHPVLLPDGRRITGPGYDAATGLLVDAPGDWPPLPDRPTRDDAVEARTRLEHLLRFYPWVSAADRAVALSLILTALARAILPTAPGHGTDAPAPGTGKSLLIDAAAILSTGTTAAVMDYGRDPTEATKRLDGMLLAGDAVISIDNIEAAIEGAALCQTLTQGSRRIRPLGASVMVTVPCTALLTLNGNNLTLRGDIVRRVLVCRLDAKCERPELRQIEQDLLSDVRQQRGELVRDAQTIMAAYVAAGRPRQKLPALGGFREWSGMVRDALVWSGAEDPVSSMERTRADDPMAQEVRAVLAAWREAFGAEAVTAADAIQRADPDPELRKEGAKPDQRLREAIELAALRRGKLDARALSYWLRAHRDVRVGTMTLRRADGSHGGIARWKVVT
jgi:putative DNA primase/helicase